MPKEVFGAEHTYLPQRALLTYEEIESIARAAVSLGVSKLRLTGGEPLLRRQVERLVASLAAIEGVDDLALTTNGAALPARAPALKEAGLDRITVSLDALTDEVFRSLNDVDFPVARVLAGIEAARQAGLTPVKVNVVVQRGRNDTEIVPIAEHFRDQPDVIVRFIEFMDVGATNGWRREDVVAADEILERLAAGGFDLSAQSPVRPGEVAKRWRDRKSGAEIGVIASVTQPFCGACNRLRLSADGHLYTCLFATGGHDLRPTLRTETRGPEAVRNELARIWLGRRDRYSEERGVRDGRDGGERVEMSYIGG